MDSIISFLTSPGMVSSYVVVAIISALLGLLQRLRNRSMKKRAASTSFDDKQKRMTSNLFVTAQYLLIAIGVLLVLQLNGVNVSAMVTAFGVAGIVIGFALQDALSDVIMGIHIMTDGFFRVGDVIRFEDIEGEVILITPQTTKVKSVFDGSVTSISNRKISQATLVANQWDVDVPLEYEADSQKVKEAMGRVVELANMVPDVSDCAFLGVQAFEDSDVLYKLRFNCDPRKRFAAKRAINGIIFEQLNEAGLSIPYTQIEYRQKPAAEVSAPVLADDSALR